MTAELYIFNCANPKKSIRICYKDVQDVFRYLYVRNASGSFRQHPCNQTTRRREDGIPIEPELRLASPHPPTWVISSGSADRLLIESPPIMLHTSHSPVFNFRITLIRGRRAHWRVYLRLVLKRTSFLMPVNLILSEGM